MQKNILITGKNKSGKSTLMKNVIASIPHKVGFVTHEIPGVEKRVGFEMETHIGDRTTLAHVDFHTPYEVGRYHVDVAGLDSVVEKVSDFACDDILYIDEIGQMELFSEKFKELVTAYLDGPNTCIATITCVYDDDFTKFIRERDDIILVEVTPETRDEAFEYVQQLLRKVEKARGYIAQPGRFQIDGSHITLQSKHAERHLSVTDGTWQCDCEFYQQHQICSHIIAAREVASRCYPM